MKNLHLIPTDKPSRLYKRNHDNSFGFSTDYFPNIGDTLNQNIYITSDEEVKEGDYFLYDGTKIRYKSNGTEYHGRDLCHISGNHRYPVSESKKIILTTDQDLIKNGVQAIDDEFLEWFIKNPNCEEVGITFGCMEIRQCMCDSKVRCLNPGYEIIIPQEEDLCHYSGLPSPSAYIEEHKQETLEEAARRYTESTPDNDAIRIFSFIEGAKWQADRMYSEEEVLKIVTSCKEYLSFGDEFDEKEWFEQHKKK
jgi:hypothetical protein